MNIIEHYTPEENKNEQIYFNVILPLLVFWSVLTFILFCTLIQDQNKHQQTGERTQYMLFLPDSVINNQYVEWKRKTKEHDGGIPCCRTGQDDASSR